MTSGVDTIHTIGTLAREYTGGTFLISMVRRSKSARMMVLVLLILLALLCKNANASAFSTPSSSPSPPPPSSSSPAATNICPVVVLDVDGTLYEDNNLIETQIRDNCYVFGAKAANLSPDECEAMHTAMGSTIAGMADLLNNKDVFVDYYNHCYPQLDMSRLRQYSSGDDKTGYSHSSAVGMAQGLQALYSLPKHIPIVVASNSPVFHVRRVLCRLGLADLKVAAVITPEQRGGITKCEPAFWEPLLEMFPKNTHQCYLFDDNALNMRTVAGVGMTGVRVSSNFVKGVSGAGLSFDKALTSFLRDLEEKEEEKEVEKEVEKGVQEGGEQQQRRRTPLAQMRSRTRTEHFCFDENRYLRAKNGEADSRAFSRPVLNRLATALADRQRITRSAEGGRLLRVVDIGAGHLNMLEVVLLLAINEKKSGSLAASTYASSSGSAYDPSLTSDSASVSVSASDEAERVVDSLHYVAFESNANLFAHVKETLEAMGLFQDDGHQASGSRPRVRGGRGRIHYDNLENDNGDNDNDNFNDNDSDNDSDNDGRRQGSESRSRVRDGLGQVHHGDNDSIDGADRINAGDDANEEGAGAAAQGFSHTAARQQPRSNSHTDSSNVDVLSVASFTGEVGGMRVTVDVVREDFMSPLAAPALRSLARRFDQLALRHAHRGSAKIKEAHGTCGRSPVDLVVGACVADLLPPRALVAQLIELAGDSDGALVYLPITFNGSTALRPASQILASEGRHVDSKSKIQSNSKSNSDIGLPENGKAKPWNRLFPKRGSSGSDSTALTEEPEDTPPSNISPSALALTPFQVARRDQLGIVGCEEVFSEYHRFLVRQGHHLSSDRLLAAMRLHGLRVLDCQSSDWVITNPGPDLPVGTKRKGPEPHSMWQCMLHFLQQGTFFRLNGRFDMHSWFSALERATPGSLQLVVSNVDILAALPLIDNSIAKGVDTGAEAGVYSHPRVVFGNASSADFTQAASFHPPAEEGRPSFYSQVEIEQNTEVDADTDTDTVTQSTAQTERKTDKESGIETDVETETCIESISEAQSEAPTGKLEAEAEAQEEVEEEERYGEELCTVEFVGPKQIRVARSSRPRASDLRPKDLLIRTACSLVSTGTELKVYNGDFDGDSAADLTIASMAEGMSFPMTYGYCLAGMVEAVGAGFSAAEARHWRGKRVFAFSHHATFATCDAADVQLIPDDVSFEDAVFLPSVETAVSLAMAARPVIGERVAVIGQGLIGLLTACVLAAALPSNELTLVDVSAHRLAVSSEVVQAVSASGAAPRIWNPLSAAGEKDAEEHKGRRFDVVVEVTGRMAGLQTATDVTVNDGTIVLGSWYGQGSGGLRLGMDFHRSNIKLVASQVSKVPSALSGRWTKQRRFGFAWDIVKRVRPSQMLAAQMRHRADLQSRPTSCDERAGGTVNMMSQKAVSRAYDDLDKGRLITVLLRGAPASAKKRD